MGDAGAWVKAHQGEVLVVGTVAVAVIGYLTLKATKQSASKDSQVTLLPNAGPATDATTQTTVQANARQLEWIKQWLKDHAVKPTPVKPTPVKPTPVKPTPVKPTPVKPTPVKETANWNAFYHYVNIGDWVGAYRQYDLISASDRKNGYSNWGILQMQQILKGHVRPGLATSHQGSVSSPPPSGTSTVTAFHAAAPVARVAPLTAPKSAG